LKLAGKVDTAGDIFGDWARKKERMGEFTGEGTVARGMEGDGGV